MYSKKPTIHKIYKHIKHTEQILIQTISYIINGIKAEIPDIASTNSNESISIIMICCNIHNNEHHILSLKTLSICNYKIIT